MASEFGNCGGGVVAYREFLQRTEGKANIMRHTLTGRERFFDELEKNPVLSRYQPDVKVFLKAMYGGKLDPTLDRKLQWLIATAKLNQAERFAIGLGEAYGKDQDKFDTEPELIYVQLQEHYHSRLLADVVSMFGLPMPTIPPTLLIRQMLKPFVILPHKRTLVAVAAFEMVGCRLMVAMRDEGLRLFSDEPEVAAQIKMLYDEIYADEIGHVGFLAAKLGKTGKSISRWLYRNLVWRVVCGAVAEFECLFAKGVLKDCMQQEFDVYKMAQDFPDRAYAAAAINT